MGKGRTLKELLTAIHENAKSKGFHEHGPAEIHKEATMLALIGTEVAEAIEAHRTGDMEGMAEELADVVIRVLDVCGYFSIDIEKEILNKMQYNESRPRMHGKRY